MNQFFASGGQRIKPTYMWLSFFFFIAATGNQYAKLSFFLNIRGNMYFIVGILKTQQKHTKKYKENYLFLDTGNNPSVNYKL